MLIPAAITTAPRGAETLTKTIASLAAAGWPNPDVFADPGAGSQSWRGSWGNFLFALRALTRGCPCADAYAIFQDDVLLAAGLRAWLEPQLWPCPSVGLLSLYTASAVAVDLLPGWNALPHHATPRRAYGALGLLIPAHVAKLLLENPPYPNEKTKTDIFLAMWAKEHRLSWVNHKPSLAEHIGEVSAIKVDPRDGEPLPERPWNASRFAGEWLRSVPET